MIAVGDKAKEPIKFHTVYSVGLRTGVLTVQYSPGSRRSVRPFPLGPSACRRQPSVPGVEGARFHGVQNGTKIRQSPGERAVVIRGALRAGSPTWSASETWDDEGDGWSCATAADRNGGGADRGRRGSAAAILLGFRFLRITLPFPRLRRGGGGFVEGGAARGERCTIRSGHQQGSARRGPVPPSRRRGWTPMQRRRPRGSAK